MRDNKTVLLTSAILLLLGVVFFGTDPSLSGMPIVPTQEFVSISQKTLTQPICCVYAEYDETKERIIDMSLVEDTISFSNNAKKFCEDDTSRRRRGLPFHSYHEGKCAVCGDGIIQERNDYKQKEQCDDALPLRRTYACSPGYNPVCKSCRIECRRSWWYTFFRRG